MSIVTCPHCPSREDWERRDKRIADLEADRQLTQRVRYSGTNPLRVSTPTVFCEGDIA